MTPKEKNVIWIVIFLILLIASLYFGIYKNYGKEFIVSNNGNFLFYNSPVVAESDMYTFVAFVNNKGDIVVDQYNSNNISQVVNTFIVHKYNDKIAQVNKSIKQTLRADDHAAPAIFYDDNSKRLFLATSYHCSDLRIYEYDKEKNNFLLYKHLKGRYTYPRFIKSGSEILLLVRNLEIVNNIKFGNLVCFSDKDDFTTKKMIKKALPDSVVYASRPFVADNKIYFTYAHHFYKSGNMLGWKILEFDPVINIITKEIDLTGFLGSTYFYNRPTSIAMTKDKILVATSYFNEKKNFKQENLYAWNNTVLILKINRNNWNKEIIHKKISMAPYYNTDVFIDEKLNWLYFDRNMTVSNQPTNTTCFNHKYMMYPNIFKDSVLYAKVNGESYSIRDQNNSIILCTKYFE